MTNIYQTEDEIQEHLRDRLEFARRKKLFFYNDHGVCINPEVVFQNSSSTNQDLKLEICEKENKWTFGYSYNYNFKGIGGGSSPCSFFEWNSFESKDKAIQEAIKQMRSLQYFKKGDCCEWHLEEVNKFEASLNQLTLF
jgi:hypothetical protein